jgi:Na+/proline symporter
MTTRTINLLSSKALLGLSIVALVTVLTGYLQQPQPDEGAAAHIFQLSIIALMPTLLVFVVTANWKEPSRNLRPLGIAATLLVGAFCALYYLEHYFWKVAVRP